jgi:hypothetical protein
MDQLKFIALDKDDLEVVSAHVQDSVVTVADVHWRPHENRIVIALNRFDWLTADGGDFRRCRSALRFDRVLACKCRNIDPAGKDAVLNLLHIEFEENDTPGGAVTLIFSGGSVLRLEVECLECELADLGPSWKTTICPGHAETEPGPQRLQG